MTPPAHHLVSRGYQQNFASQDKRVDILSAKTGEVIERGRAIKSNWSRPGFSGFVDDDGKFVAELEIQWARVERFVLDQIRRVGPKNCGPDQRAAVYALMAIHLVRSESFEKMHRTVMSELRLSFPNDLEDDADATVAFSRSFGREPRAGELSDLARGQIDRAGATRWTLVDSFARNHNKIIEMLSEFHVQVVTTNTSGPGFVVADVPVIHSDGTRYGFRDGLALGDANFIMAPLTRWTAVALSAQPRPHVHFTTKKKTQLANAAFVRGAVAEIACHPDDTRDTSRLWQRLDRLPIELLVTAG